MDADITETLAEICGVGNVTRKVNIRARERIREALERSELDIQMKVALLSFGAAYCQGDSKECIIEMLQTPLLNLSGADAERLCGLSCLKW